MVYVDHLLVRFLLPSNHHQQYVFFGSRSHLKKSGLYGRRSPQRTEIKLARDSLVTKFIFKKGNFDRPKSATNCLKENVQLLTCHILSYLIISYHTISIVSSKSHFFTFLASCFLQRSKTENWTHLPSPKGLHHRSVPGPLGIYGFNGWQLTSTN